MNNKKEKQKRTGNSDNKAEEIKNRELMIPEMEADEIQTPVENAAKKIPTNPSLPKFRTADGPFGWFAHGVTGDELNRFVGDIQKHLIESHENHIELQDKYEQLIWDLGEFDKKYLQENIKSVKASQQAYQEARDVRKEIDSLINDNASLKKKLRIAYWIAGLSVLMSVVALALNFIM